MFRLFRSCLARRARAPAMFAIALLTLAAPARGQNNPENNEDFCRKIWQQVGIPDGGDGDTTIVCHKGYIVGHNDGRKAPNWVIERLDPALTGSKDDKEKASRKSKKFSPDKLLPDAAQATLADYAGTSDIFDQGHNAPAADFGGNQEFLNDTFFLSNSVPQIGEGFNRSVWRALENAVRDMIGDNHPEMIVITGSVWQGSKPIKVTNDVCRTELTLPKLTRASICPANGADETKKCDAGVAVPAAMFKVVYDPVMMHAFAVLMENRNHTGLYKSGKPRPYLEAHKVGVGTIEDLTGLRFFSALDARKQNQIRSNCVDVRFH